MTDSATKNADSAGALTPQQARFVREYLIDLNASKAAVRAGYSVRSAESQGSRLLSNAKISAAVTAGQRRIASALDISAGKVLRELARIAFADMRRVAKWSEGAIVLRNSDELSDDEAAAVVEISESQHGLKVKLADKRAALVDLGKHLSLWNGRPIEIDLPQISTAADVSLAIGRVVEAVANGSLLPDEGTALAGILETRRRALETVDIETRLAALEAERGVPMGGRA